MAKPLELDQQWVERITEQVNGMQYGSINITVHDGRIVQIDRTERTRYDQSTHKQSHHEQPVKSTSNNNSNSNNNDTLRIVQ